MNKGLLSWLIRSGKRLLESVGLGKLNVFGNDPDMYRMYGGLFVDYK